MIESTTGIYGSFWIPNDKTRVLRGLIVNNEDHLIIDAGTPENFAYLSSSLANEKSIILQGKLDDERKITLINSLSGKRENFSAPNKYSATFNFNIRYLFYNEHFSSDVRFKALTINFVNIQDWVSPHDILFGNEEKLRKEIELDINNEFSFKFFYGKPLTENDNATTRNKENVYIRIDSKTNSSPFERLLEMQKIIQDFLNFVIAGQTVYVKSIYGIIATNNEEKLIPIKDKSLNNDVIKFKSNRRTVFQFKDYEDRLEYIIKKWFDIKNSHEAIYNYYVDSMYNQSAIELSYFKIAAFLEGYHREIVEKKSESNMRKLIDIHFKLINIMLEEMEVNENERKVIKTILNNNRELSFKQRLIDIFESYQDILIVNIPIISFFDAERLHKWIDKRLTDSSIKVKIIQVIDKKLMADREISSEKRKTLYSEILDFILTENPSLGYIITSLARFLLLEKLSQEFTDYRNVMAHAKEQKYRKIGANQWFFGFKELETIARICILNLLGLSYQEICQIHYLNKFDETTTLRYILESNIGHDLG